MEPATREQLKQDLKQTMLALDEVSDAMSNATFEIVGNLSMEEAKILHKMRAKQMEHKKLQVLSSEADQVFERLLHENARQKKIDDAFKKTRELRDKKIAISEEIRVLERSLESVRIGQEGGGLIQATLTANFDALLGKVRRISMLFPDLYAEVQDEIKMIYQIRQDMLDRPTF